MDLLYKDVGGTAFDAVSGAEVPVDIWILRVEPEDAEYVPDVVLWKLTAALYCPRVARIQRDGSIRVISADRAVLAAIVQKYYLPLYETAVSRLKAFTTDPGQSSLYYWRD